jgi:hypothetical protein
MPSIAFIDLVVLSGLGLSCAIGTLALRELWRGYAELLTRARRSPRFGIGSLCGVVTIAAVASALLRLSESAVGPIPLALIGFMAFLLAVGTVVTLRFVAGDLAEVFGARRSHVPRNEGTTSQGG